MLKSNQYIDKTALRFIVVILILFFFQGCGIYTVPRALNPPFGQQRDGNNYLKFSGDNTETYFSGYVLWYKGVDDTDYQVCEYQGNPPNKPTISKDEITGMPITIYFTELGHQEESRTFKELLEDGYEFEFAVSSYGDKGEESEKVKF